MFDPEGQTVMTTTSDDVVRLWEVASGKPVGPGFKIGRRFPDAVHQHVGRKVLAIGADPTMAIILDAGRGGHSDPGYGMRAGSLPWPPAATGKRC